MILRGACFSAGSEVWNVVQETATKGSTSQGFSGAPSGIGSVFQEIRSDGLDNQVRIICSGMAGRRGQKVVEMCHGVLP
jgi:hypothetical protein